MNSAEHGEEDRNSQVDTHFSIAQKKKAISGWVDLQHQLSRQIIIVSSDHKLLENTDILTGPNVEPGCMT